jgi:predicted secreted hydrolase
MRQGLMTRGMLLVALFVSAGCVAADVFKQAIEPRKLVYPQDHGSHEGFQTEWWYVTGNIRDENGRRFGYQFTIFRRAMDPKDAQQRGRTSKWAVNDFFIGHLAISDIDSKKFYFEEHAQRGVLGLAEATESTAVSPQNLPRVWLDKWEMKRAEKAWELTAAQGEIALALTISETVPPVAHGRPGEEGLSRKGPKPGQASYYYSVPQLATTGSISIAGKQYKIVDGRSWMDHEFGSNQLSEQQAGWDWFAIHLKDGRSLMIYLLRMKDGSIEPASSATWIDEKGGAEYIALADLRITPDRRWTSPRSKGQYAVEWKIEIARLKVSLDVKVAQDEQEVNASKTAGVSYYEGAVDVSGSVNGAAVSGDGYLEMTGVPGAESRGGRGLGGML